MIRHEGAAAAMLSWFRKHFERHEKPPKKRTSDSGMLVRHDEKEIVVRQSGGAQERVAWAELASVTVMTTDTGPLVTDLFWVLTDRSGRRVTIPIDTEGEHDLLKAMQARLHGFDNMAVVEAMSSTENASFLVWEREARA